MTWFDWAVLIAAGGLFLFVIGPIAMHLWGSMFGKGFGSSIAKYFNKQKQNKDEQETK